MSTVDLESTAKALVSNGKGILAAVETTRTLTKRFYGVHITSTPESFSYGSAAALGKYTPATLGEFAA